jgi:hypothetical protein
MSIEFVRGMSSEGIPVAEADLGDADPGEVIEAARREGVDLLWLHTNRELGGFGFTRRTGYTRLRAEKPPPGRPLEELSPNELYATLQRAYLGLWGHKQVAADHTAPAGAVVLGLYDDGVPVGVCTVFPELRLVDGPGVDPAVRTPDAYLRLLDGACALLGDDPIDLDSWGDAAEVLEAYETRGFRTVESDGGWELQLSFE